MRTEKNTLIREILASLEKNKNYKGEIWYRLPHCSYSDYSGCAVEVSNARILKEKYSLSVEYGYYGSQWLIITARELFAMELDTLECLKSDLESLLKFPILDEDDYSALELENLDYCIVNGSFDLGYAIKHLWDRLFPGLPLQAILDDLINPEMNEPYFDLSEWLEINQKELIQKIIIVTGKQKFQISPL